MSLSTAEEITNLYLYGVKTKPGNFVDNNLIRSNVVETLITVDINEYMDNGPGRFASPAFFEIVKLFFSPTSSGLAPGVYTEQQLRPLIGTNQATITQQQWAYDDGQGDYAERTYIWNTVAFEIRDSAQFVIEANGDRYIEDFAIIPFSSNEIEGSVIENFDFKSDDWIATLGNNLLEERIDPSGIGRKVVIGFSGDRTAVRYDFVSYQNDTASAVLANSFLLAGLYSAITDLTDQLFQTGAIKFLDGSKPVLYGTDGIDILDGTVSATGVDLAGQRYLKDYIDNGIYYIAGNGNDTIVSTDKSDILNGGNGLDTYVVDGNDRIIDSDGQGIVLDKNGNSIIGAFMQQADGTYVFLADNNISATKNSPLTLYLVDGSTVVIEDHANSGDFGIFLVDEGESASSLFDLTIAGDLQPENPIAVDDLGNIVVGAEEAPDREDTLYGSANNDLIRGLGGDDDVDAKAGEDRIEGGAGEDDLEGGADNDIVLGGADSDILSGSEGNDWLYAETEYTIEEAYTLGETQDAGGQKGDLLGGGIGDDTLIGEAGKDILLGDMGKDVIMGLGGDDNGETAGLPFLPGLHQKQLNACCNTTSKWRFAA